MMTSSAGSSTDCASPLVELLAARHGLGTARSTVLDAETARFEARARLARLAGRTITGEPIQ